MPDPAAIGILFPKDEDLRTGRAFGAGLQDTGRDRLGLFQTSLIDEEASAFLPDAAEIAGLLEPPNDPGGLELARDRIRVLVSELTELNCCDPLAHGRIMTAKRWVAVLALLMSLSFFIPTKAANRSIALTPFDHRD